MASELILMSSCILYLSSESCQQVHVTLPSTCSVLLCVLSQTDTCEYICCHHNSKNKRLSTGYTLLGTKFHPASSKLHQVMNWQMCYDPRLLLFTFFSCNQDASNCKASKVSWGIYSSNETIHVSDPLFVEYLGLLSLVDGLSDSLSNQWGPRSRMWMSSRWKVWPVVCWWSNAAG